MGIEKELSGFFSEMINQEIFGEIEKPNLRTTNDKGRFFFTCLTEHVFNGYMDKKLADEDYTMLKIYISNLVWKFVEPKFSNQKYLSDISELKNKNSYELYEINKSTADQALFFSSLIDDNANSKIKMKKDVLTHTGKNIYHKLSADKISKTRNMSYIYHILYEKFEDTQNCLNIMGNYYSFLDKNIN